MSPQNPAEPYFPNSTREYLTSQKQRRNQGTIKYLLLLTCLVIPVANVYPASAHSVKIAGDVGGTLHIEPNDNPRAGEPTQAWFALTRKGGRVIPLAQCNCRLAVYAQPYAPGEPPLLEPSLNPVAAERYQGIPGAEVVFPKPGIYQLQLNGKPTSGETFRPFNLKFEVTVAAGTSNNPQDLQDVNSGVAQGESRQLPLLAIALPILGFVGILFVVLQSMRGRRE